MLTVVVMHNLKVLYGGDGHASMEIEHVRLRPFIPLRLLVLENYQRLIARGIHVPHAFVLADQTLAISVFGI
jgi:hypothetical protein